MQPIAVFVGKKKGVGGTTGTTHTSSSSSASDSPQGPTGTRALSRSGGPSRTQPSPPQTGSDSLSHSSPDSPGRYPASARAANTLSARPGKPFTLTAPNTPPRPRLGSCRDAREKAARKTADDRADAILHQMREWLSQGHTTEAIRLIDQALSDIALDQPARFQWRLLKGLSTALIDPATPGDLKNCKGIAQAIQVLAQKGWWNPTQKPFLFLSPVHRQALLARCDWDLRVAILGQDIERQLMGPADLFNMCDIAVLLDHMDRVFQDAQEHQDRSCLKKVLHWAQHLQGLATASSSASAPIPENVALQALLPDRCTRLIDNCLATLSHDQTKAIHVDEKLTLTLHHDWLSQTWVLKSHKPVDGPNVDATTSSPAAFIAAIDGLLAEPDGPPWQVLEDCVTQACQSRGWPGPSQRFSLALEFARRGEPQALADLLRQEGAEEQFSQTQRLKLLEICDPKDLRAEVDTPLPRPALSLEARIELLRLASPLFPERSPLRPMYEERCSSCEALRLQQETPSPPRKEGRQGLAIGSARSSQRGSPQQSTVMDRRLSAPLTQEDQ